MHYIINNALILQKENWRENDLKITILTKNGKQELLARGAKNIHSKLNPLLTKGTVCNLWIAQSKRQNLNTITDTQIITNVFEILAKKGAHLKFTLRALEELNNITYPELDASSLQKNLLQLLNNLPYIKIQDLPTLWIHFQLLVLEYLGVKPKKLPKVTIKELSKYLDAQIKKHIF